MWAGPDRALFIYWPHKDMGDSPVGLASIRIPDNKVIVHCSDHRYWHPTGSPDQRYAVADTMDGEIYWIDLVLSQDKLLVKWDRTDGMQAHSHPSVSPDGKRVLFVSEQFGNSDLMTVEIPPWEKIPSTQPME